MLSTVHPGDLSAGSFQRSPKYLHSSAVWPACNPASLKTPCLSDSRTDFSMGGAGITQHSSHKVFRELSFAQEERAHSTNQDSFTNTFITFNESALLEERKRQEKGHLANAVSLHPTASHSPGRLRNDGQVCTTALVGKVGLNLLAVRSLPCRFAARDALPCERGVLTAQQLQTCLVLFEEKPLLLQ